ncbi:hypothetical protein [Pseudomonas sp. FP2338]|uniref:hypothetical protein n=1 Tax=Pseudomonas sp. FP2338 TaxID=2954093 RepID=UPI0027331407|nr:hypothetical protein [Pseudomonas sp. FP2338]WLH87393.1 hypothetical protein PSH96_13375 [Pseudomonas sp. FP2338]
MSDINVKQGHHHHVDSEASVSRRYLKEFKASLTEDDIAQVLRAPNELKSRKVLNDMRVHFSQESVDAMLKEPDAKEVSEILIEIGKFLEKNCDEACVKASTQLFFSDYQAAYNERKIALLLRLISGKDDYGFRHVFQFFKGTAGAFAQLNDSVKDTAQTVTNMNTITATLNPEHIQTRMKAL